MTSYTVRPNERLRSAALVVLIHLGLAYALLRGLAVVTVPAPTSFTGLIEVVLPPRQPSLRPPPPTPRPRPRLSPRTLPAGATAAASRAVAGAPNGPMVMAADVPTAQTSIFAKTPAGGGSGAGGTAGAFGRGGGNADGQGGLGEGLDGGADISWVSGAITPSDYPRSALKAGIGGRVAFSFTVGERGRVTDCTITRSSGNAELDSKTCQVIIQRFRYRPATDDSGRPISQVVDGDHIWSTDAD